ncbi:MAG: hypothetical protein LBI30_04165 [Holosporales bacterium]|jgi:hypothetical protein|nr:hypothetical protein [Holosporales bacterium]
MRGEFYSDPERKNCLFRGQVDFSRREIDVFDCVHRHSAQKLRGYGKHESLYAQPDGFYVECYTFFNCEDGDRAGKLKFSSCAVRIAGKNSGFHTGMDATKDEEATFVLKDDKYSQVSLQIADLDRWLWSSRNTSERNSLWDSEIDKSVELEDFSIKISTFKDRADFRESSISYLQRTIRRYHRIDISCKKEQQIEYFYDISRKLVDLFSILLHNRLNAGYMCSGENSKDGFRKEFYPNFLSERSFSQKGNSLFIFHNRHRRGGLLPRNQGRFLRISKTILQKI